MILFPAIDLKDGQCVRLVRGDMANSTVFSLDPASQARQFEADGASWLHLVDLNGAFAGEPVNAASVRQILSAITIPVQLGGGIRSLETIEYWLRQGVARIILGTAALRQPELVYEACRSFPGKISVGIDAKGGKVAVAGWAEVSTMPVLDLALRFEDAGVAAIIYTNVDHDGVMQGPDLISTRALAQAISIPVIVSGGVSCLEDLQAVKTLEADGVVGVISGRALYEGAFTLREAIICLEAQNPKSH